MGGLTVGLVGGLSPPKFINSGRLTAIRPQKNTKIASWIGQLDDLTTCTYKNHWYKGTTVHSDVNRLNFNRLKILID